MSQTQDDAETVQIVFYLPLPLRAWGARKVHAIHAHVDGCPDCRQRLLRKLGVTPSDAGKTFYVNWPCDEWVAFMDVHST